MLTDYGLYGYLREMSRLGKSMRIESRLVSAWGWNWVVTANEYNVPFRGDEDFLTLDCGDGCTALCEHATPLNFVVWEIRAQ